MIHNIHQYMRQEEYIKYLKREIKLLEVELDDHFDALSKIEKKIVLADERLDYFVKELAANEDGDT
jgi:hypothetical protein